MVLDLEREKLFALKDAAALIPPGRGGGNTTVRTLRRWASDGIRLSDGSIVRVEVIRTPSRTLTTAGALSRFFSRISGQEPVARPETAQPVGLLR